MCTTAYAAEYKLSFENLPVGKYSPVAENGFSWQKDVTVVNDDIHCMNNSYQQLLKIPESSRTITAGAKIKAKDFLSVKFPMCFKGGKVSDNEFGGYALLKNNAWDGGTGLIPQNSQTVYNPDSILLSAGWGKRLNENDNDVYVYKNEWFYSKIAYDYTDNSFKVYYSYDGNRYRCVYNEKIENTVDGEKTLIRSVFFDSGLYYENIDVNCDTDSVYNVLMLNSKNEKIDFPDNGESFEIRADIYDYNNCINEIYSAAAVYDESNRLKEVKLSELKKTAEKNNIMGNFELCSAKNGTYIKYFAWDKNMKPYCNSVIFKR